MTMPDPSRGPPDPFLDSSLELLGLGHEGIIYGINTDIVIKAPRTHDTYGLPEDEQQHLSHDQTRSLDMLAKERISFEKIGSHPNIVSTISLENPAGLYLQRYATDVDLFLEANSKPSRRIRLGWYIDMLRALLHMHQQKLLHSDVHESNMLCNGNGHNVALCDFPTSAIWGETPSQRDRANVGGRVMVPFDVFDDRLDRFQAAKLMLRQECGDDKDWLTYAEKGEIVLAQPVKTGNADLDVVIHNGLLAQYEDTKAMLEDLEAIAVQEGASIIADPDYLSRHIVEQARLKEQIASWRTERVRALGKHN